jgi:hypothetical protein
MGHSDHSPEFILLGVQWASRVNMKDFSHHPIFLQTHFCCSCQSCFHLMDLELYKSRPIYFPSFLFFIHKVLRQFHIYQWKLHKNSPTTLPARWLSSDTDVFALGHDRKVMISSVWSTETGPRGEHWGAHRGNYLPKLSGPQESLGEWGPDPRVGDSLTLEDVPITQRTIIYHKNVILLLKM